MTTFVLLNTSLQARTKSNVSNVKPESWCEKNSEPVFFNIVLTISYDQIQYVLI